jgi:hypothetical protein
MLLVLLMFRPPLAFLRPQLTAVEKIKMMGVGWPPAINLIPDLVKIDYIFHI